MPMKTHKHYCAGLVLAALLIPANWLSAADAQPLWDKHCAACHGKDGKGETKMGRKAGAKDYTDPKVQATLKDAQAFQSVKEGLKEGDKERMKPFAEKLTDDEIKALIAYLKAFNKAP